MIFATTRDVCFVQMRATCTSVATTCTRRRVWRCITSATSRRRTTTCCSNSSLRSSRNPASTFCERKNSSVCCNCHLIIHTCSLVFHIEDYRFSSKCSWMCTGYIVFSGIRRASGVQGLRVIVQSDRPPTFVDQRIEAFLVKMGVSTCSSHTHTWRHH